MRGALRFAILIFSPFCLSAFVLAQPQQSEHFRITKSVLDAGGGASASEHFQLLSAFGQPSPLGTQTSASFVLHAGFLSPAFAISPLSPITDLVIQRLETTSDVRLDWSDIPGAGIYTVYRSTVPFFTPAPEHLIGTTGIPTYTDTGAVALPEARYYYIVTAGTARAAAPHRPPQAAKGALSK